MPEDALDLFIDARLDLLIDRLRSYIDPIRVDVIDSHSTEDQQDGEDEIARQADPVGGYSANAS